MEMDPEVDARICVELGSDLNTDIAMVQVPELDLATNMGLDMDMMMIITIGESIHIHEESDYRY